VCAIALGGSNSLLRQSPIKLAPYVSQLETKRGFFSTALSSSNISQLEPQPQSQQKALVWLRTSLRVNDNHALSCGVKMGPDGLAVLYAWSRGSMIPQTPAAVFECAAARALQKSLQARQQTLSILHTTTQNDTIHQVANVIKEIQPSTLILDNHEHPNDADQLQDLFPNLDILQIRDENTLLHPFSKTRFALGRSRKGGKIARWATFLSKLKDESFERPLAELPSVLPPPIHITLCTQSLPEPTAAGKWAKGLLQQWGDITENEAMLRANEYSAMDDAAKEYSNLGNAGKQTIDTKLSPFLRWGLISPRQAAAAGVRQRDLLWRDWSHVCYHRMLQPLQRGDPVVELLDRCYMYKQNDDKNNKNNDSTDNDEEELKFRAWCVGNTGAPLVDAGMRQLWLEGWMPRQVRLVCASCLVEGLQIDWRKGRDWFEHTLVDHDFAINEMMWQNAGFCGVDPFYRGMEWEKSIQDEDHYAEYVDHYLNQQLNWPLKLREYTKTNIRRPDWVQLAPVKRTVLARGGVYKAASRVVNSGVRVAWPGSNSGDVVADGEVWGVGCTSIKELAFDISLSVES